MLKRSLLLFSDDIFILIIFYVLCFNLFCKYTCRLKRYQVCYQQLTSSSCKMSVKYTLKLFKSREKLEIFRSLWYTVHPSPSDLLSTWCRRRMIWLNHNQTKLICFFRRGGHPSSHFEWEDGLSLARIWRVWKHKVLLVLMKHIYSILIQVC